MMVEGRIDAVDHAAYRNTVAKLRRDAGTTCQKYQNKHLRGIKARRIQCDEISSFVIKQRNVPADLKGTFGYGDAYTRTATDADPSLCRAGMSEGVILALRMISCAT